jgi:choline dehydrogenase-like flavoprotein
MVLEQLPNPDSRVTLSRTVDALGRPQARLDWRLSDADRRGWSAILAALDGNLRREGLGRLNHLPRAGDATVFDRLRPACHHMGTTRMSDRPETGVVDRNGRVHGVGNLFVAGGSVFPTSGHANPMLTAITLSIRLAHHLADVLP